MAPAGMTLGLAEQEEDPEPTSACVVITGYVPKTEERASLQLPAHLLADQLTLMCAVSGAGSRGRAWAFPVSQAAPDLPSPDVDSCDLGPRPSFPTDSPCALRDSPHPQALNVHRGTVGLAFRDPCRPMRRMEQRESGQGLAGLGGAGQGRGAQGGAARTLGPWAIGRAGLRGLRTSAAPAMDLTAWETQTPTKALGGVVSGETAPEWGAGSTGWQNGRQMPQDGQV